MELLKTVNLTMQFGGLTAVNKMNFHINKREIVGVIGPNGSGKTTFFNLLSGIYQPTAGEIVFEGKNIAGAHPDYNFKVGIARTFQNGRLFWGLNVLENVMVGMHTKHRSYLLGAIFKSPLARKEEQETIKRAKEILKFFSPHLLNYHDVLAKNLSYADRRRLEICRALVSYPKLLLLDEPSAGMDPRETEELMEDIHRIKEIEPDISIILIEHDMKFVEGLAQRVVVFNYGTKIAEGSFAEVSSNPEVVTAYLGEEEYAC